MWAGLGWSFANRCRICNIVTGGERERERAPTQQIHLMALATAGGAVLAVSAPQYVDEVDAEDDRVVDLCVAEVNPTAVSLPKLKMRVEGSDEVFQQWGLSEDEPEDESSLVEKMQRGVSIRRRRINKEPPSNLVSPLCYRGPPSFDLDEECQFPPLFIFLILDERSLFDCSQLIMLCIYSHCTAWASHTCPGSSSKLVGQHLFHQGAPFDCGLSNQSVWFCFCQGRPGSQASIPLPP
jgi:hypothetical protein